MKKCVLGILFGIFSLPLICYILSKNFINAELEEGRWVKEIIEKKIGSIKIQMKHGC